MPTHAPNAPTDRRLLGAPEGLCLAFANTRFWRGQPIPTETLLAPRDLLHWCATDGLADPATVAEAVKLMKAENISALIVKDVCRTEGNTLAGVLSERDVVHALLERGGSLLSMPVSQLMTRQPVTCAPSDSVQQALQLMDKHHIRHLPVLEDGHLVGVVSARDFTRLHLQELEGTVASVAEPPPATTSYAH